VVGIRGAQDEQPVFSACIPTGEIVDVLHGVATDALAHDLGGVVQMLGPRQFDGLAEFLDSADC